MNTAAEQVPLFASLVALGRSSTEPEDGPPSLCFLFLLCVCSLDDGCSSSRKRPAFSASLHDEGVSK